MAAIQVDSKQYEAKAGQNLLEACLGLGFDLPYFCWHPALGSVGACRQCAVVQYMNDADNRGKLVMACMTPVAEAMRIGIHESQAEEFRRGNIELLMTNHPHDCPVCEEGGECHLQDMTLMTGHTFRRYRGLKRTHKNQHLGPFINHEMNRCIACYRCVRFYDDYAGGKDLQVLGISSNVYFGRAEDGILENEFSGNLVEVCPTGVFTDKTYSDHYIRKWDLQTAPSVCVHCSLGCNITPGERYGKLRRITNRYHGDINRYFLCDRGQFGYGFVNSPRRIKTIVSDGARIDPTTAEQQVRGLLHTGEAVIGIGSPRASLEANFALRTLVGADHFYSGLEENEQNLLELIVKLMAEGGIYSPSLTEVEQADAVLILGEDLTNSAPRLALSVRQAARNAAFALAGKLKIPAWQDNAVRLLEKNNRSPIYIASICATRLDDIATECYQGSSDNLARLGFAIAHRLNPQAPKPAGISQEEDRLAAGIASAMHQAARPLIISGAGSGSRFVLEAAYDIAKALPPLSRNLAFALPESNSLGLAMMGGKRLKEGLEQIQHDNSSTVIILENDLYRRTPGEMIDAALARARQIIAIDSITTATTAKANLVLPAASYAESEGTLVNNEGRAQRYFPVFKPDGDIRANWQWLLSFMPQSEWRHFDDLTSACAQAFPILSGITEAVPDPKSLIKGMKIPRQTPRVSGRTAVSANLNVSEPRTPEDNETPFAYSMEGSIAKIPPALEPEFWAPRWSSNQSINKFQDEIGGHLKGRETGIKLFKRKAGELDWFTIIPEVFIPKEGVWHIVFLPHIFGSEELSRLSAPIAERMPNPYVLLNPADAENLKLEAENLLEIKSHSGKSSLTLPVRTDQSLPSGLAGLPAGFPESASLSWLEQVDLTKAGSTEGQVRPETGEEES